MSDLETRFDEVQQHYYDHIDSGDGLARMTFDELWWLMESLGLREVCEHGRTKPHLVQPPAESYIDKEGKLWLHQGSLIPCPGPSHESSISWADGVTRDMDRETFIPSEEVERLGGLVEHGEA